MAQTSAACILDSTLLCSNFPEYVPDEILREHILHTLEFMLTSGDTDIAVVWGPEGIGKTILLAQFARTRADRTASIFIRSNTRFGYQPEHILTDLTNQLGWLVDGEEPKKDDFDDAHLSKCIYQLQRKATRLNQKYFIVVDGIDDIPSQDKLAADTILSRLPLSYPQFRFVFSAHKSHLSIDRLAKLRQTALPLTPFGLPEARSFMGSQASSGFVEELYKVTKGIPGDLASYKRMLTSIPESQLLAELPVTLTDKYEVEWRSIDPSDKLQTKVLAIVALDRTAHTLSDLSFFLKTLESGIKSAIANLSFLEVGTGPSGEVRFVSEAFRRFAGTKLSEWKETINQMLIDALFAEPNSNRSLYRLPAYLEDAQQHERLLSYLSPEHFAKMLEHSQSTTPLRHQAELGLQTAAKLHKDGDLARFAVQESSILDLDAFAVSRAEIDARVAIGDDQAALALASSAVLKQDRLRLLATLCRGKQNSGRSLDSAILDQIRILLNEVDIRDLGQRAMELAIDLMRFMPDKAINVVERMSKAPNAASMDIALAQLSIAGIAAQEEQASEVKRNCDTIRNHIKDPELRNLSTSMALAFGGYDGQKIMAEAERLEKPVDKVFLLRQWASRTNDYSSVPEVLKYSIRLIISASEYTPNATHLRQLSTPLPSISNSAVIEDLVGSFDAQRENTERLGPTEDYVWLQLQIAEAETRLSSARACDRVVEVYLYVTQRSDLTVKTACLARLLSYLHRIDPAGELESKLGLQTIIRTDFDSCTTRLLSDTASHEQVTENILIALAPHNPDAAIKLANMLNVEPRRDAAYATILDKYLEFAGGDVNLSLVNDLISRICDSEHREEQSAEVVSRLAKHQDDLLSPSGEMFAFIKEIETLNDPVLRIKSLANAITLLARLKDSQATSLPESLRAHLASSWNDIDDDWIKVDLGFEVGSILADYDRVLALQCIAEANKHRKTLRLFEGSASYLYCVRLAIRAFAGLAENMANAAEDLYRLEQLIQQVPSARHVARLWGDVALRAFGMANGALGRQIVNEKLRPVILTLESQNRAEWARIVFVLAPALYSSHPMSALEIVTRLPKDWVDFALHEIILFIFRKTPSSDPFDSTNEQYRLTYEEVLDICSLLDRIETDWMIYRTIEVIVDSIQWKENRTNISASHKADIEQRLHKICESRLLHLDL